MTQETKDKVVLAIADGCDTFGKLQQHLTITNKDLDSIADVYCQTGLIHLTLDNPVKQILKDIPPETPLSLTELGKDRLYILRKEQQTIERENRAIRVATNAFYAGCVGVLVTLIGLVLTAR